MNMNIMNKFFNSYVINTECVFMSFSNTLNYILIDLTFVINYNNYFLKY